jgi:uncharacterized phage-associated protein
MHRVGSAGIALFRQRKRMTRAIDIARLFIKLAAAEEEPGNLTNLQLHKLLYFAQAWSLAIRGNPLYVDRIEAWRHGPIVPAVHATYKEYGSRPIDPESAGQPSGLSDETIAFVRSIWESYKGYSALRLRDMTHQETPWLAAREGCRADDCTHAEISHEAMMKYFRRRYQKVCIPGLELDRIRKAKEDFAQGRGRRLEDVLAELGHERVPD